MADLAKLVIEIDSNGVVKATGNLNDLIKKGKTAETATQKLESGWSKMSRTIVTLNQGFQLASGTVRAVVNTFKALTDAYKVQETAELKLTAALKATHGAVGMSQGALQDYATELSRATGISDESVIATEALMTTFTQVGKDVFPTAIEAAADMSKMFGQDLQQSAIQLGTALNDPIAGVGRLKRIGISFTSTQKDMIKKFMETNDIASAQKVILDELNNEFGGVAKTIGGSALGAVDRMKNSVTDLKEALGRNITEGMKPMANATANLVNKLTDWVNKNTDIKQFLDSVESGSVKAGISIETLRASLKRLDENYIRTATGASSGLDGALEKYNRERKLIVDQINAVEALDAAKKRSAAMDKRYAKEKDEAARKAKEAADEALQHAKDRETTATEAIKLQTAFWEINQKVQGGLIKTNGIEEKRSVLQNVLSDLISKRFRVEGAGYKYIIDLAKQYGVTLENQKPESNIVKGLREQVDLLGKTDNEILKYKLATEGATDAEIKEAIALNDKLTAANKVAEMEKRGKELKKQYRTEVERLADAEKEINDLYAAGAIDLETKNRAMRDLKQTTDLYKDTIGQLEESLKSIAQSSAIDAFEGLGKSLATSKDSAKSFEESMAEIGVSILQQLPMLLLQGGLQLLSTPAWPVGVGLILASGLVAIAGGYASQKLDEAKSTTNSANGNIFSNGNIIPFANGGSLVNSPTLFPMANGGTGLMGEAGPEAIIPLERTSDGKLGVNAKGSGSNVEINIINNTSEKADVKKTTTNGGKQIYSIVIGSVKKGFATGEFDGDMRNNYGISRRGVAG